MATQREVLTSNSISAAAGAAIGAFHHDIVRTVQQAVAQNAIVVVGMAQNPFVKKACANLKNAGLEYKYIGFGSYVSQWKQRLAIKLWSGWPTYPQVFVRGVLIGGNDELEKAIADGNIKDSLASKRKENLA